MTRLKKYLYFSWLYILVLATPCLAQDPLDKLFAKTGVNRSNVKVENMEAAHTPLIDAHNHLNKNIPAETLISAMGNAGVKRMVLMPRHYKSPRDGGLSSDEQAKDYARKYPGRSVDGNDQFALGGVGHRCEGALYMAERTRAEPHKSQRNTREDQAERQC